VIVGARRGEPIRQPLDSEPLSAPAPPAAGARTQRAAVAVVAIAAFAAAAWVASALWAGLLVGLLTAFAVEPAFRRLVRRYPTRRGLAAVLVVGVVALGVVALAAIVVVILADELVDGVRALRNTIAALTSGRPRDATLSRWLDAVGLTPAVLSERATRLTERAAELASGAVSVVLGSAFSWLAGALIALVTAYYTLRDRRPIERRLEQLLPLHPETTRELLQEFRRVGRGTLVGSALAALVQGVLAAIGFAIGGVGRALLLGILTAAASLVPALGTMLVWIPVGVVLVADGRVAAGVFELVWGVLVTSSMVDYVLRPVLVGRESRSHPLLFLVGLIGGVEVLGGIGILAGPLVMAFFASALRIYQREVVEVPDTETE
jgi:predicted PurR-regulated permease PerM